MSPIPAIRIGTPVEVRVGYNGSWSAGFDIADILVGGYQVRRRSDGQLLPAPTGLADVRRDLRGRREDIESKGIAVPATQVGAASPRVTRP